MKYADKLNLKSSIYKYDKTQRLKSNTPTKSGNKSKNKSMIKQPLKPIINPNDLFQKVCCPNCKYSFKIIKNQVLKQIKSNDKSVSKSKSYSINNKVIKKQNKQIQTQSKYTLSFDNINNKQSQLMRYSRNSTYLSPKKHNNKNSDSSLNDIQNYKQSQLYRLNYLLTQQKYLNNSQYLFKPLSVSQTNIKNNNQQLKTEREKEYKQKVEIYREDQNNNQNQEQDEKQYQDKQVNKTYTVNKSHTKNRNISNSKINDKIDSQQYNYQIKRNYINRDNNDNRQQQQKIYCDQCGKNINNKNNISNSISKSTLRNSNHNHNNNNNPNNNEYLQSSKNKYPSNYLQLQQTQLAPQQSHKLFQLILSNQQTQNSYNQIISLCKTLSKQVQLPSFCKMLTYTIHNIEEEEVN